MWYIVVFALIQIVVSPIVGIASMAIQGMDMSVIMAKTAHLSLPADGPTLVVASAVASVVTIVLFARLRWAPLSGTYLRSRPWAVVLWTIVLALGSIIPSEWVQEQTNADMPEAFKQMFSAIMSVKGGYFAIAILAPLAEEMVFRGAVLRTLLDVTGNGRHWLAIGISAVAFGLVHGNEAQFLHATVLGLVLGWMYYRTRSIVPGMVLHVVNNTVAFLMFRLMPNMADAKLIDLFAGDGQKELMAVGFSLCLLLPALYQLALRLKR